MTFQLAVVRFAIVAVLFGAAASGCDESNGNPRSIDDGGQSGSAAKAGAGGAGGAGGEPGFPPCELSSSDEQPRMSIGVVGSLGLPRAQGGTERAGVIARVEDELLEITSGQDTLSFRWSGPPLTAAFSVGEQLQLYGSFPLASFGQGGRSRVRSAHATAVVIDAAPWTVLSMSPGSHQALGGFIGMPTLDYSLSSCCSTGQRRYSCDYSSLVATYDGMSVSIESGARGDVGSWTVTNLRSQYFVGGEYVWTVAVTLLGPGGADDAGIDAGI